MSVTLQAAAAATGNGNPLNVAGAASATLQVSGTFVGTVVFEQTTDGVAWRRLPVSAAADGAASTQATAPGTFAAAVVGATSVRARVDAYTSGTITVIGQTGAPLPPLAADVPALTLSKISDAGNAASKNTGTSGSTVALGNHTHAGTGLSDVTPLVESGGGAAGTGTAASREDHVHPADAGGGDPLVLGDPTAMGIGAVTNVHLVVANAAADTNAQFASAVFGCSDPTFGMDGLDAYSGTNAGVYGVSVSDAGVKGVSASGTGVRGQSTGAGAGVYGTSFTGPALVAAATYALDAQGYIRLSTTSEPASPAAGYVVFYCDGADGIVKIKTSAGVVHALW